MVFAMKGQRNRVQQGIDLRGNSFYTYEDEGGTVRRAVDYKGEHDPNTLDPLWYSWLSWKSSAAPTMHDLTTLDKFKAEQRRRVQILEAADAKLQQQERANARAESETSEFQLPGTKNTRYR